MRPPAVKTPMQCPLPSQRFLPGAVVPPQNGAPLTLWTVAMPPKLAITGAKPWDKFTLFVVDPDAPEPVRTGQAEVAFEQWGRVHAPAPVFMAPHTAPTACLCSMTHCASHVSEMPPAEEAHSAVQPARHLV